MERTEKQGRGWILGAALLRGTLGPGLNSAMGILFPALCGALSASVGQVSLFVTLSSLWGFLALPACGRLMGKWSPLVLGITAIGLVGGAFCLIACVDFVWQLWLLSMPFGVGTVIGVNLLGPYLVYGAPGRGRGVYLGTMIALSSCVGVVLHPLLSGWIQALGWRRAVLVAGGVCILGTALCLPTLRGRGRAERDRERYSHTHHRGRLLLPVLFAGAIAGFNLLHQHFSVMAQSGGMEREEGLALGLSMACAALGGLYLGWLVERKGAFSCARVNLLIGGASLVCLMLNSPTGFLLGACLHGFASSGIGVTVPALVGEVAGRGEYGECLGQVSRAIPLSGIVAMPLYALYFDRTGSYGGILWLLLGLLTVCLLVLHPVGEGTKKHRPT